MDLAEAVHTITLIRDIGLYYNINSSIICLITYCICIYILHMKIYPRLRIYLKGSFGKLPAQFYPINHLNQGSLKQYCRYFLLSGVKLTWFLIEINIIHGSGWAWAQGGIPFY